MAEWKLYFWDTGEDTSAAAGTQIFNTAEADYSIAFGGTGRSSYLTNITKDTWNLSMHYSTATAESASDACSSPHMWPLTPVALDFTGLDTGCVLDGTYINMASGTPDPARGVGLSFEHSFDVRCNPVQIWGGTGTDVDGVPSNCYIAMCDLTSSVPTWSTTKPASKLLLKGHTAAATLHWWNVGIAVAPLAVGANGANKFKVECTYY